MMIRIRDGHQRRKLTIMLQKFMKYQFKLSFDSSRGSWRSEYHSVPWNSYRKFGHASHWSQICATPVDRWSKTESSWCDFLAKHTTTVLPQPLYSPDLAPADFFLFLKLKSTLKGRRFESTEAMKTNSLAHLRSIPKKAFQECFRTLKVTRLNSFKVRRENFYAIYSGIFRTDLVHTCNSYCQLTTSLHIHKQQLLPIQYMPAYTATTAKVNSPHPCRWRHAVYWHPCLAITFPDPSQDWTGLLSSPQYSGTQK